MDFSKANLGGILGHTFTAPVSGLLQAHPYSTDVWLSWLHFGTCTVFYRMTPYREDELLGVLHSRVEGWEVVASNGRRRRFEIRARGWKFSGTLVALKSPDNDDYVDLAMKAFEATGGPVSSPKSSVT